MIKTLNLAISGMISLLLFTAPARADAQDYGPGSISGPLTQQAHGAVARYGQEINRQLFNQFGLGTRSRNVYCYGPAIIRFQIMPDGTVRDVKLLRASLPALNARLVTKLSNTVFPRFYPGMPDRPYTKIFHYGVTPLAEYHFNAEKLACR
jgi:hypothetical protein